MKNLVLSIMLLVLVADTIGQTVYKVDFVKTADSIQKNTKKEKIFKYYIKGVTDETKKFTVDIEVDYSKSSLAATEYSIDFDQITLKELVDAKTYPFYVNLKPDSLPDRSKKLVLVLKVRDSVGKVVASEYSKEGMEMQIIVDEDPATSEATNNDTLKDYQYLSYVGTNFDLVDGVQANNLFFATNIFLLPPKKKGGWGMYLSLYGNRAFSSIDSASIALRSTGSKRVNDSTVSIYRDQAKSVKTTTSDNIGAFISGLVKMGWMSKETNNIQLYYSPSLEFVWRRTQISTTFKDAMPLDTVNVTDRSPGYPIFAPNSFISKLNEFSFKVGFLGVFIKHENKNISVRVNASVGYSSTYTPYGRIASQTSETTFRPKGDIFFTGRAWLTEAVSGVTLQAEIINYLINPRPLYVVTLSKAIKFNSLGTLFSPITAR